MDTKLEAELEELVGSTLVLDENSCAIKLNLGDYGIYCARYETHKGCHFAKFGNAFIAWPQTKD